MSFLLYLSNDDGGMWYFFPANPLEKLNCSRPLLSMTIQINSLCAPIPNSQNSLFVYNILLIFAKSGVSSKYCEGVHVSVSEIFMRVSHLLFSVPPSASIPSLVNAILSVAAPLLFLAILFSSFLCRCSAFLFSSLRFSAFAWQRESDQSDSFASPLVATRRNSIAFLCGAPRRLSMPLLISSPPR